MPAAQAQLRAGLGEAINYKALGSGLVEELRRNPPVNKWSHFEYAREQAEYTKRNSSF